MRVSVSMLTQLPTPLDCISSAARSPPSQAPAASATPSSSVVSTTSRIAARAAQLDQPRMTGIRYISHLAHPPRFSPAKIVGPVLGRVVMRPFGGRRLAPRENFRIGGAAAQIAGEIMPDVVVARVGMRVEQLVRHQDETGRAESALECAGLDEGFLHRIELFARRPSPRPSRPSRRRRTTRDTGSPTPPRR